jgi:hypothetical protein
MIGLIVKGSAALFLEGLDPGTGAAVALVNRHKLGNIRSRASKLAELGLEPTARPKPLVRESLTWAYVFVALTEGDDRRLEPGPFDDELATIVATVEAEPRPEAEPA